MKLLHTLPLCLLSLAAATTQAEESSAGGCRYVRIATLPVTMQGNQAIIGGSIDGKDATMLVDTGSSATFLMRSSAEQRGLTLHPTGKHAKGVGGYTSLYKVNLQDFSAGGARSGKVTVPVLGEVGMKASYDAILGADFLMQADMEVSIAEKQLKFYKATGCPDTFLAYWDREAMEVPFARSDGERRNPLVTVQINGQALTAMIDTGASSSALSMDAAKRLGMGPDAPGVTRDGEYKGVGTDQAARYRAMFDSFTIGTETIKNAAINIVERSDKAGGVYDLILGMDFLRAHRILFANSQDRLYISYVGGDVFARPTGPRKP